MKKFDAFIWQIAALFSYPIPLSSYLRKIPMPVITPETVTLLTPHIIDLIKNVFKSRNKETGGKGSQEGSRESSVESLSRDVFELQEVASKHGSAIAEIAQKVEVKLAKLERQLKWQRLFSLTAIVIAVIATGIALAKSV